MNLSDAGLDLIIECEGKLMDLGDGRYAAYRCPAGVWTIYIGCTEGVSEGMIVTEDEGREMLRKELAKHEAAVTRLVTVDLTQGQYDALVSFSYNVGSGALGSSTLLKKLNRGDAAGACAEFAKWNKAAGKVLRGLTIRRAKEAALFATRDEVPLMPQKIEVPKDPMTPLQLATVVGGGATAVNQAVPMLPAASKSAESAVDMMAGVKQIGGALQEFTGWAAANPKIAGPAMILIVLPLLWPYVQAYLPKAK